MHLVMFDIDGTLTETMKVDEECFVRSFKDVFGFADIDTDWSHYPRTTDSGIFHDVFTARIGRSPTAQEVSGSIESHLLLGRGVIRPVSRWQVLACATMIIQQRRATMRLIERLSSSCPCKGQPSGIARLAALFMLETGCGMLVRVAASAFRSLALARAVARHGCRQRELFASSLISVTRIYF